jgi:hypothetical protein
VWILEIQKIPRRASLASFLSIQHSQKDHNRIMMRVAWMLPLFFACRVDSFGARSRKGRRGSTLQLSLLRLDSNGAWNKFQNIEDTTTSSRRSLLMGTASVAAALTATAGMKRYTFAQKQSQQSIGTVSDALEWMDRSCDRRFLHAVVSSNYKFLYRGCSVQPGSGGGGPSLRNEVPDLLMLDTYGSVAAQEYFVALEELLKDELVRPSTGHLATTSIRDASAWGDNVVSMWPCAGAHYAWYQDFGLFYPRATTTTTTTSKGGSTGSIRNGAVASIDRMSLIVDGRDCGKDSLDDALCAPSCEILVATPSFLAVPISMEKELRQKLQRSFLV